MTNSQTKQCHTECLFLTFVYFLQQLADESQVRIELQMALDSKDSDIEQLRSLLNSLNVQSLDSASMSSGPDMDTDESLAGTVLKFFLKRLFTLLSSLLFYNFFKNSLSFLHVVPYHPPFFLLVLVWFSVQLLIFHPSPHCRA